MRPQRTPRPLDHEQKRIQKSFGRAVEELRVRRGVSQEGLGLRSDLHRNYVGTIERGEINPTLRVLLKLCGGLHVEISELIFLFEERHDFWELPHQAIHGHRRPRAAHPRNDPLLSTGESWDANRQ